MPKPAVQPLVTPLPQDAPAPIAPELSTRALKRAMLRGDAATAALALATVAYEANRLRPSDPRGWLDDVERGARWLEDCTSEPVRATLRAAQQGLGRTALALSGGASLGFYHLGVVKALHERELLPDLISGSSIGAMIAAGVCVRNDEELHGLFADLPAMRRDGLAMGGVRHLLRHRAAFDPRQLESVLNHNIGVHTFREAFARSGRTLTITLSPTRPGQAPTLLCHGTAPDHLVVPAVLASSALPGLYPAAHLRRRTAEGLVVEETEERWSDGSLRHDLPREPLVQQHGAGFVIASQTNLHVLPFIASGALLRRAVNSVRHPSSHALRVPRALSRRTRLGTALDHLHHLGTQSYGGDVDIIPRLRPSALAKVVRNPTLRDLEEHIAEGERAVTPMLPTIAVQHRLRAALLPFA